MPANSIGRKQFANVNQNVKLSGKSTDEDRTDWDLMENELSRLAMEEACHLLDQALVKIKHCIEQLDEDSQIWHRPNPSMNSIGNLLLHIEGNLSQWALAGIKGRNDTRQREKEFSPDIHLEKKELLERLCDTVQKSKQLFISLSPNELLDDRNIQGFKTKVYCAINHTVTHFVGHTHQIIFQTRLQLGDKYQFQWTPESSRNTLPI